MFLFSLFPTSPLGENRAVPENHCTICFIFATMNYCQKVNYAVCVLLARLSITSSFSKVGFLRDPSMLAIARGINASSCDCTCTWSMSRSLHTTRSKKKNVHSIGHSPLGLFRTNVNKNFYYTPACRG